MARFTVVRIYDDDDKDFKGDAYVKLVDENEKVVMEGDWYHDKIDVEIEGFFEALDYLDVGYERTLVQQNESDGERT